VDYHLLVSQGLPVQQEFLLAVRESRRQLVRQQDCPQRVYPQPVFLLQACHPKQARQVYQPEASLLGSQVSQLVLGLLQEQD
jgi:hypothetical protein